MPGIGFGEIARVEPSISEVYIQNLLQMRDIGYLFQPGLKGEQRKSASPLLWIELHTVDRILTFSI